MTYLNGRQAVVIKDSGTFKKGEIIIMSGNPYYWQRGKDNYSLIYAVNREGVIGRIPTKKIRMIVKSSG